MPGRRSQQGRRNASNLSLAARRDLPMFRAGGWSDHRPGQFSQSRRAEDSMGWVFAVAVAIALIGTGPSVAQMVVVGGSPTPSAGTASSLGTLNSPVGGAGIPLAPTELFPGGLSPAPSGPIECPVLTGSAVVPFSPSPASPSNTFDAGGTISTDVNTGLTVGCGTVADGFPVLSGLSSVPGSGAVTSSAPISLCGANIPIGASDLSGAGLGGLIGVPVPSPSIAACPGPGGIATGIAPALGSGSPIGGNIPAPGVSLPFGC
jgi:hypothetical protein